LDHWTNDEYEQHCKERYNLLAWAKKRVLKVHTPYNKYSKRIAQTYFLALCIEDIVLSAKLSS